MQKYISILRGINVAGQRKILMKDLKEVYQNLGFLNVETYIQSGNVIFETDLDRSEISTKIEKAIFEKYAFEVPVIIRTKEELHKIQSSNPFFAQSQTQEEKEKLVNDNLYLTFLREIPINENLEKVKEIKSKITDKFEIIDDFIFIFYAEKYSDSKLTNNFFEKKLNTKATTRNWKTIEKLVELINQ